MNHSQIVAKWRGKNVNEKGFRPECVAWAKKYCEELGFPLKSFGGSAKKGWISGSPFDSRWRRVQKTAMNFPPMGAVVFWDTGEYGHVSIANGLCNPLVLRHIDQNGGGKYEVIQNRWSGYKGVVGWYVLK